MNNHTDQPTQQAFPHGPAAYSTAGTPSASPDAPAPKQKSWFARHKFLTTLLVVVGLIVVGGAIGGGDDDASPATSEGITGQDGAAPVDEGEEGDDDAGGEDIAPAAEPGIGDPARDGKFEFTVTDVESGVASVGDDFLSEEAQGQFVLVHLTVSNIGNEAQMLSGSNQTLIDTQGREHSANTSAAIYLDRAQTFLNDINPGNSVDGIVVFDIPADAEPAAIELHDSIFSGGVTVSLAG